MSCTAAPVGEVISAIRRGYGGMGFLRAGSKRPSAVSFSFNCSKARYSAPTPSG